MSSPRHVPVLLDRVVALLAPALERDGAVMVDATLGLGGHSEAVLSRLGRARVIGVDRDPAGLELAAARLAPFGDRFTPVHAVYDEIPDVLEELGLAAVDAVLFDLGVSSMQLDVRERRGPELGAVRHSAFHKRVDPDVQCVAWVVSGEDRLGVVGAFDVELGDEADDVGGVTSGSAHRGAELHGEKRIGRRHFDADTVAVVKRSPVDGLAPVGEELGGIGVQPIRRPITLDSDPLGDANESVVRVQACVDIDRSAAVDVGERQCGTSHDADPDGADPCGLDSFDEIVQSIDE